MSNNSEWNFSDGGANRERSGSGAKGFENACDFVITAIVFGGMEALSGEWFPRFSRCIVTIGNVTMSLNEPVFYFPVSN
jgi:hypothetical protein